jgi:hypothetical protein
VVLSQRTSRFSQDFHPNSRITASLPFLISPAQRT